MAHIFKDVIGSLWTACFEYVLHRRQGQSNDFLACVDDPLNVLPICSSAVHIPSCYAVCQSALSTAVVEGLEQPRQFVLFKCFLRSRVCTLLPKVDDELFGLLYVECEVIVFPAFC